MKVFLAAAVGLVAVVGIFALTPPQEDTSFKPNTSAEVPSSSSSGTVKIEESIAAQSAERDETRAALEAMAGTQTPEEIAAIQASGSPSAALIGEDGSVLAAMKLPLD